MGYKYTVKPSKQMSIIFIFYCIYIFRAFLSKKLFYFLSFKKYLFKYKRVITFIKEDIL